MLERVIMLRRGYNSARLAIPETNELSDFKRVTMHTKEEFFVLGEGRKGGSFLRQEKCICGSLSPV